MKHSVPDSLKFKKLQRRLGTSRVVTAGTLELLWIATQKNAMRGDIGRFTNEEIAIECDWDGDPDELVTALVDTGWLDESDEHRLVVHDWLEHCPKYLKAAVMRSGGFAEFQDQTGPKTPSKTTPKTMPKTPPKAPPKTESSTGGQRNLTKPNLTKPNDSSTASTGVDGDGGFGDFWSAVHRKVGRGAARKAFDRAAQRVSKRDGTDRRQAAEFITEAMRRFAASPRARDDVKGQIHPATWLNEERYDDDPAEWQANTRDGPVPMSEDCRRAEEIRQRTRAAGMKRRASEQQIHAAIAKRLIEAGLFDRYAMPREREAAEVFAAKPVVGRIKVREVMEEEK